MNSQKNAADKIISISNACKISDRAFEYILPYLQEGVTEKKIVKKINDYLRKHSEGLAFKTIVAFGENSAEIHHQFPTEKALKKGDIIMLDFGAKINGYPSDMTRTLFFGKASQKQKSIYGAVYEAQQQAIEQLRSLAMKQSVVKIKAYDIDKIARDYIASKKFTPMHHSLGHGIGKKVHSGLRISPKSKAYLKPGMIFSIEPAIYVEGFGGIRIEDLVLLKKDKIEILTKSPKEMIEL